MDIKREATFTPPLSCEIDIKRAISGGQATATITMYNVKETTRAIFERRDIENTQIKVSIQVGYENRLYDCFIGFVLEGASRKEKTEWVSKIECKSFLYESISATISAGETLDDVLKRMSSDSFVQPEIAEDELKNTTPFAKKNKRPLALFGDFLDIVNTYSQKAYVENNKLYIVNDDLVLKNRTAYIIDSSILLSSPNKSLANITCELILFPKVQMLDNVILESLDKKCNGTYKVTGIHHTISVRGDSAGTSKTELTLLGAI
jgi:hypothetical protein